MLMSEVEQRKLYDIKRQEVGTIRKGEPTPDGKYIVVVMVWIQNSDGKFLIQKRSERKNSLFASTGGHPKLGETSLQGMITEIKEELGLDIKPEELRFYCTGRSDKNSVFFDDYYLKLDIPDLNQLKLEPLEVDSVCWLTAEEVRHLAETGKFFEGHFAEFDILLDWLKSDNKEVVNVVHQ